MRRCCLALALLLLPWPAPPAAAQERGDGTGLVIQVDAWWVSPRNTDLDYAFLLTSGNPGGDLQTLTYDRAVIPEIYTGWRFNAPGSLEVAARLWEFNESTSGTAAGSQPLTVGALLANPAFSIGTSFVDSAAARGNLRSISMDLGVKWMHQLGGSGELDVFGGFRLFRFEESFSVAYRRDLAGGQLDEEFINSRTDSKGLGLTTGVGYRQKIGKRFSLGVGFGLAIPVGDLEGSSSDEALVDGNRAGFAEVRVDETRAFLQLGGDFGFQAQLSRGWFVNLSYAVQYWSGVSRGQRFVDVRSRSTTVDSQQDVVWEGWRLGFKYSFP